MIPKGQLRTLLIVFLTVFFMSQGCVATNSLVATQIAIPTVTYTSQPTKTQTLHIIEPLVTGSRLRFDSWSPDSLWFAYWVAKGDDVLAHPAFVDVQSGKICQHEEVSVVGIESGNVKWLEYGKVNITDYSEKKTFRGALCDPFSEIEFVPPANKMNFLSPDGHYRADTIISGYNQELTHNITTITDVSKNQVIVSIRWDSGPHTWAESGWLTNALYLIGLDVIKQKVIYASVLDGKVGDVVTDIMKLRTQDVGDIFHVGRYADTVEGEFHLLLEKANESPSPLLLYHSETGLVEKLPFYKSWIIDGSTFSLDGKWLFLSYPSSKQNDETSDFWIRSVDPPDSLSSKLADEMNFSGLSNVLHKIVFIDKNYVLYVLNFPNGEIVSQWGASGYQIDRVWWSADGTRLAMQGFPTSTKPEAIFVIAP